MNSLINNILAMLLTLSLSVSSYASLTDNSLTFTEKPNVSTRITGNVSQNILAMAGISQDSYSKDKKGSGVATTSAQQKGHIKQSATGTTISSGGSLKIDSDGGDVNILASNLDAEENLIFGDTKIKRDENGKPLLDDNGQYITEDGSSINNLTIGTVELTDKSWDKKQSGLKGPLKDLAAAATLALSASGVGQLAMAAGVNPEITVGKSSETVVESTTHQTSTLNAGDKLIVRTDGDTRIEGADISANTAYLETRNTTITAVENTTTTTESQSTHTVAGTKGELKKDEVTVAGVTETKHKETTTTTDTELKKSSISVGSLVMNSEEGINVLASDIEVEGDASVKANKIRIAGMTEETTTEHQEKTETTTTSVGVKNAYVDAAYAAEAVADAGAAVEDAQEALDDARRRVKDGTLAADAVSDYEANLAAATAQLSQATISLAASGATAAGTTATGGFYASGSAEKTITEKTTTSTEQRYVGSSFNVGGDARFDAAQSIDIIGSSMDIGGGLGLNANDVTIKAGTEESTSSSSETTRTAGMTVSYGSGGSDLAGGVNASGSNTDSDSYSKTHINSTINAGSLSSNSENLTLSGANVEIAGDIDIETSNLLIESVQDVATSSSKTEGYNVSGNFGADADLSPGSFGANQNNSSSDSKWVNNQTTLIGGSSGTGEVNISADKTTVRGAMVTSATRNEDGTLTDNNNLALITGELIVEDIQDKNHSQSEGFNVSTSGYSSTGSTTVGLTSNGHEAEQTTFATLGGGNVTKKDGTAHDLADTNRDLNNSQQITKDQQTAGLDATVTVDHRLASEEGRKDIANDIEDSADHVEEISTSVKQVVKLDTLGVTDLGTLIDDKAKIRTGVANVHKDGKAQESINSADGTAEDNQKALSKLAQELTGDKQQQIDLYSKGENGAENLKGFYDKRDGQIAVNTQQTDMTNAADKTEVVGHESYHAKLNQRGGKTSESDREALADDAGKRTARHWNKENRRKGITNKTGNNKNWNTKNSASTALSDGNKAINGKKASDVEALLPEFVENARDAMNKHQEESQQASEQMGGDTTGTALSLAAIPGDVTMAAADGAVTVIDKATDLIGAAGLLGKDLQQEAFGNIKDDLDAIGEAYDNREELLKSTKEGAKKFGNDLKEGNPGALRKLGAGAGEILMPGGAVAKANKATKGNLQTTDANAIISTNGNTTNVDTETPQPNLNNPSADTSTVNAPRTAANDAYGNESNVVELSNRNSNQNVDAAGVEQKATGTDGASGNTIVASHGSGSGSGVGGRGSVNTNVDRSTDSNVSTGSATAKLGERSQKMLQVIMQLGI